MKQCVVFLAILAFFSSLRTEAVIALNTSTSDFNALNLGGPSDPVADNQANKPDIELVGSDSAELYAFYGGFLDNGSSSTTDGDVFFRVRVAGNSGLPELGGYVFIGLDITGDGALDYFIQHGGNPTQQIAILRADLSAANNSPDTLSLGQTLFTTDVVDYGEAGANSYFTDVVDIDPGLTGTDYDPYDLDGGDDADHFLTFTFDFAELVNVIRTDAANDSLDDDLDDSFEWFDDSFSMQMVLMTSQDVNNINSDLGGIDGDSTDQFNTGGGISTPVDPGGEDIVPEPATYALLFGLAALGCAACRRRHK